MNMKTYYIIWREFLKQYPEVERPNCPTDGYATIYAICKRQIVTFYTEMWCLYEAAVIFV